MNLFKSTGNADQTVSDEQKSVHEAGDSGVVTPVNESETTSDKPINDASNFPDGGTKAWLNVVGGWCIFFSMFGWANAFGVFQSYYQEHQLKDYTAFQISWISSIQTFILFGGGIVAGKVYDNYGPKVLVYTGVFLHLFGMMMCSISTEYYQFILSQGVCTSIGDAALFTASLSTASTWFHKKRAFAFGILLTGTSIGGVVMPICLEHLLGSLGFGWAIRVCTFINLALLVIALPTVTSRLPPTPKPVSVIDHIRPLKEGPFLMLSGGCALFYLGMYLPFNYIIVQAEYEGMSAGLAGYLIPILNGASLFGRLIPGKIADIIGRFNTMIAMCGFAGVIVLALWLPGTANAPIIVFSALYGFASGAFISLIPPLTAQISDIREIGVRSGTLWLTVGIAALVASPIGGALEARDGGAFVGLQIFAGVTMLIGTGLFIIGRWYLAGWNFFAKV
ncbi:MFS general substrate transporter [Penicillium hordei]|uniref:MFS general substrate transporter n=1 Tax=Penicillium hordei TaxID=40994 RepID=A0AAD6E8I9_9EURO|nr:MFS general substrate transporter [Penicillium hordei]KAJ5604005.1 MFS general substrate transporter [Penicillium hordei]